MHSVGWAYLYEWVILGPWDIDKSGFTLLLCPEVL